MPRYHSVLDTASHNLDILKQSRLVIDLMHDRFESARSGLRRLYEGAVAIRETEEYATLAALLDYESRLAELNLDITLGGDGRIRGLEVRSLDECRDNPFWTRPLKRLWSPSERQVAARITVEKRQQDRFVRVPTTARSVDGFRGIFVVAPREGLATGATYRFTDRRSTLDDDHRDWADSLRPLGNGPHRQVQVTVDADPLPANSSLALKAEPAAAELIHVASGGGKCSVFGQPVPHVSIEAGLAPEAQEWRGQLLFRTLVDDELWAGAESLCSLYPSGRSWRQVANDKVYSTCWDLDARSEAPIAFREPGGRLRKLAPTKHTVKMQAFLPGTDIVLESETLTVDLSCPRAAVATWIDAAWFGMGASDQLCECPGPPYTSGFIGPADVRLPANAAGVLWLQAMEWQSAGSDSTPTIVGTLRVASTFRCGTVERLPHVQIEARLEGNGQRWRNQLLYRTFVDGEGWYGASSTCAGQLQVLETAGATVGHDVLYGRCPGEKSPEDTDYWFPHSSRLPTKSRCRPSSPAPTSHLRPRR